MMEPERTWNGDGEAGMAGSDDFEQQREYDLRWADGAEHKEPSARARMLAARPSGFTVAELRDAVGATRKHVLPLANELDARGVTRRRGDVRIAGPRLPPG